MSTTQNIAYTAIQLAHNFGAVAVVGGSISAIKFRCLETRKELAWLVFTGLLTQAASGAAFGIVSYYFYHHFPDISGIAAAALAIKISCVVIGILTMLIYIFRSKSWTLTTVNIIWFTLAALTITSLSAAAFLRWFS
jgi:uncharacterized membrane-anchored protein